MSYSTQNDCDIVVVLRVYALHLFLLSSLKVGRIAVSSESPSQVYPFHVWGDFMKRFPVPVSVIKKVFHAIVARIGRIRQQVTDALVRDGVGFKHLNSCLPVAWVSGKAKAPVGLPVKPYRAVFPRHTVDEVVDFGVCHFKRPFRLLSAGIFKIGVVVLRVEPTLDG